LKNNETIFNIHIGTLAQFARTLSLSLSPGDCTSAVQITLKDILSCLILTCKRNNGQFIILHNKIALSPCFFCAAQVNVQIVALMQYLNDIAT
jgi:hypothetical protein